MESIDYVSFWLSSPIIPIEEMMITGRPVGIQNERWKNSKIHHFRGIDWPGKSWIVQPTILNYSKVMSYDFRKMMMLEKREYAPVQPRT